MHQIQNFYDFTHRMALRYIFTLMSKFELIPEESTNRIVWKEIPSNNLSTTSKLTKSEVL